MNGTPRIARVFPRRTAATPTDPLAFTGPPPLLTLPEIDEVHISTVYTYDIQMAEWLALQWEAVGVPVKMGGPAFGDPGGDFVPGRYLRPGFVITSRGCPKRPPCWFCSVPRREGNMIRELPIRDGHNVLDSNLLACSEEHIRAVFDMLKRQPERPLFTGGLEAARLRDWHVGLLREVKTRRLYCAYDTPDDLEPLAAAGKLLRRGGIPKASHRAACYVLIGYPDDTMTAAEKRLRITWKLGFVPFAMLYRDDAGTVNREWLRFQSEWVRPQNVLRQLQPARTTKGQNLDQNKLGTPRSTWLPM